LVQVSRKYVVGENLSKNEGRESLLTENSSIANYKLQGRNRVEISEAGHAQRGYKRDESSVDQDLKLCLVDPTWWAEEVRKK